MKHGAPTYLKGLPRSLDAFDAMTHDRPYRDALPAPWALAELDRCAGTHFDPTVVEAFLIGDHPAGSRFR